VDYNWFKQGAANQLGGHLSASFSGPEGSENFLKSSDKLENACCKMK